MIKEHDLVVLTRDVEEHDLRVGDIGTVVHCFAAGDYEVEFVNAAGGTLAVLTLPSTDLRAMGAGEILHARDLAGI